MLFSHVIQKSISVLTWGKYIELKDEKLINKCPRLWKTCIYGCNKMFFFISWLQHQQEEDAEEMQKDLVELAFKKFVSCKNL